MSRSREVELGKASATWLLLFPGETRSLSGGSRVTQCQECMLVAERERAVWPPLEEETEERRLGTRVVSRGCFKLCVRVWGCLSCFADGGLYCGW